MQKLENSDNNIFDIKIIHNIFNWIGQPILTTYHSGAHTNV